MFNCIAESFRGRFEAVIGQSSAAAGSAFFVTVDFPGRIEIELCHGDYWRGLLDCSDGPAPLSVLSLAGFPPSPSLGFCFVSSFQGKFVRRRSAALGKPLRGSVFMIIHLHSISRQAIDLRYRAMR